MDGCFAPISVRLSAGGQRARARGPMALDMSTRTRVDEQALLEDTLHRPVSRMTGRELIWVLVSGVGFLTAAGAIWALDPPHAFAVLPAIACLLVLAMTVRIRFYTPLGFATP